MPSHGSLTKAGKVRMATPKIPPKPKTNPHPIKHLRAKYYKRIIYPKLATQAVPVQEKV
jgi:small subunit ribosomal protein S30e